MRLIGSDLACVRGGRLVFSGLSLAVGAGEALLVTGPNGAGKSTLLRVLAGLVRLERGRLALDGGDPERTIGEQLHYVGHQDAVKPFLTLAENLGFWTRYLGGRAQAAADGLGRLGLGELADLPAASLSAGQRRRLALARLLVVQRPIWLLDEPTAALDAGAQATLAALMRAHLSGGGLIVAAAHGPIGLDAARELRLGGAP